MKKLVVVVPLMVLSLGVSTVCADQIAPNDKKAVVNKITSIQDIADRIRESEDYLEKLPAQLDEIKGKFTKLISMGEDTEKKISRYLKFMDTCTTRELSYEGAKQCRLVINASLEGKTFEDILNEKRNKIKNALIFIEREKQRIKAQISESDVVREGVAVLNDVKDVLTLDI